MTFSGVDQAGAPGSAGGRPATGEITSSHAHLTAAMPGFWTEEAVELFAAHLTRAVHDWRMMKGPLRLIVDLRAHSVQSSTVVRSLEGMDGRFATQAGDRIALVVSSVLVKMQAERTRSTDRMRIFADLGAADSWLATDG